MTQMVLCCFAEQRESEKRLMSSLATNCLKFDGVDDYVEVELTLPGTDMTYELWFKTTLPDGGLLCVTNPERTASDCRIHLREGNLYASFWSHAPIGSTELNLADGQWHHVAHVFGTHIIGQRLYVDGHLVAQGPTAESALAEPTYVIIGWCPDTAPPYFTGCISDVRIWNTIASEGQIRDYMRTRLWGNEAGLLGYWTFKGGKPHAHPTGEGTGKQPGQKSIVTAIDKTRGQNGRIYGAQRVVDAELHLASPPSLTNPALIFDGSDDYVEVPNPFLNRQTFTIELWSRPELLDEGQEYGIIGHRDAQGWCKPGLSLVGANRGLRYEFSDATGTYYTGIVEQYFEHLGAWVHLTWVNDGPECRFYRNGTLVHSVTTGTTPFFAPSDTPYWIGRSDHFWNGQLSEVRIWETARTPKEIRQQMQHRLRGNEPGLVACWPLNEGTQVATDVTDKSHNGRVFGARLGSTKLQLRGPKSAPSSTAIASSTYTPQHDSVGELLADDNPFKALYQRLQSAKKQKSGKTTLVLNATVLGEFSLFHTLSGLHANSLTIVAPRLEFISEDTEIDWESKTAEQFMGVRLSGTTALLGMADAQVVLECVLDDNEGEPIAVLKALPTGNLHLPVKNLLSTRTTLPTQVQRLLNYIGHLHITCQALAIGSESVAGETEYPFNEGIDKGLNIYGELDLTGLDGKNPLALIRDWLQVETLDVHITLCKHKMGWQVTQETVIEKDTPVLSSVGVELVYKGATVSVDISGNPPEMAILLSNTLLLSLNWFDAEDLYLTGTMKLEPDSFTGAYTLQQSPGSENTWSPFGLKGISVQTLAMQVGGTYLAPWIDNVGIATEDVIIGNTQASLALLVDTNDPDQFIFHLSMEQTTLLELMSALTPVTFAAYQALPRRWRRILETIVDIDFRDITIHIVPAPTHIGELAFDNEGIMVKGTMSPWGWDAEVDMVIDWDDIHLSARLEPIRLQVGDVDVFAIKGMEEDAYTRLTFSLGEGTDTRWYLASKLLLLGTRHEIRTRRDESGTTLNLASYFPFLHIGLDAARHDGATTVKGKGGLILNLKKLGHSRLHHAHDLFGLAINFTLAFTGSASAMAVEWTLDIQFKWGEHHTRFSLSPGFSTDIPALRPSGRKGNGNLGQRLSAPMDATGAPPESPAEHAEDVTIPEVALQSDAVAYHNGEHDEDGDGVFHKLLHSYQQTAQQASDTVQNVGEKMATVGANLRHTVARATTSKRTQQRKGRLWLYERPA